jgi:hypothetical protein
MCTRLDLLKEVPTKLAKSLHTRLQVPQVLQEYLDQDLNQDQEFIRLAIQVCTSPALTLPFTSQVPQEPTRQEAQELQELQEL